MNDDDLLDGAGSVFASRKTPTTPPSKHYAAESIEDRKVLTEREAEDNRIARDRRVIWITATLIIVGISALARYFA